jgi:ribose transport system permease protein
VAWVRIPAFIATLATAFIFRGVTFIASHGGPVRVPTDQYGGTFTNIGTTNVGDVVPVPFLITLAAFGVGWFVLRQTGFGRHVLAVGSNEEAAGVCGISPNRVRFATLTILGAFVGLASILLTTQVWTADGGTQQGFELQVIATVVLGGTSLFGGRGTLLGTFAAALLLTAVQNLMLLSEVPVFYQRIVSGLILLLALSIDGLRQRVALAGGTMEVLHRLRRPAHV